MTLRQPLITAVALALLALPARATDPSVPTRYGTIGVANGIALTYQGKSLSPPVTGNSGLQVFPGSVYQLGDIDAVVVTDVGGSFCPSRFLVAAVSKKGIRVSKEFGNCSEAILTEVVGGKLIMTQSSKMKAGTLDRYVYDPALGVVMENGKAIR